jgi:signal peptide peptidase SppA
MTHLARVAARVFDTPLLVLPETAELIASNLADRFGVEALVEPSAAIPRRQRADGSVAQLYEMDGGIATIPVHGELVNRGAWIGASSGLTSYEGLQAQLRDAANNPKVEGIVLDMDSPGGEAAGAMETGALVQEIAASKPIVAYVDSLAASAGYAIASGASHIVTTLSGRLGSIGVVMLHRDTTGQAAKSGVKPTIILSDDADYKLDGSSLVPLTDDSIARLKASLNELRDLFYTTVTTNRAQLSANALRALKGGTKMGESAVKAGLADAVGGRDTALAYLRQSRIGKTMTDLPVTTIAKSDHDRVVADTERTALSLGFQEATKRISAILTSSEAKGREELAQHMAFSTEMPAEAAIALLGKAPTASAPVEPTHSRLSGQVPNPNVAPDAPAAAKTDAMPWDVIAGKLNKEGAANSRAYAVPADSIWF